MQHAGECLLTQVVLNHSLESELQLGSKVAGVGGESESSHASLVVGHWEVGLGKGGHTHWLDIRGCNNRLSEGDNGQVVVQVCWGELGMDLNGGGLTPFQKFAISVSETNVPPTESNNQSSVI